MTTATVSKSASGRFGRNVHIDRMVGIFLSLIKKPDALDELSGAKISAEHDLSEAESRYMDAQFRLAQLNLAAPEATGDERKAIDKERHDLRHNLEDMPTDIEHAARKVLEAENRLFSTFSSMVDSEISRAYQQALETKSDEDISFHNQVRDRGNSVRHMLIHHTDPADVAASITEEIVRRYSTTQGIEREYKRRQHAELDQDRFPTLVAELNDRSSAYIARQEDRFQEIQKLLDQAKGDAMVSNGEHRRITGSLEGMQRRGNTPVGFQVSGSKALGDLQRIREIEDVIRRVLR